MVHDYAIIEADQLKDGKQLAIHDLPTNQLLLYEQESYSTNTRNLYEANEVHNEARPSFTRSRTDIIEKVLLVKGDTTLASASDSAMPVHKSSAANER